MKEIKFRVWNTETNKMITNVKEMGVFALQSIYSIDEFLVIPTNEKYPLMQYTGLKDKNGVEAYHKDIGIDKFNKKVIIEWNENHLCYGLLTIDDIVKDEWNFCLKDLVEIIGNIYENKEELA